MGKKEKTDGPGEAPDLRGQVPIVSAAQTLVDMLHRSCGLHRTGCDQTHWHDCAQERIE